MYKIINKCYHVCKLSDTNKNNYLKNYIQISCLMTLNVHF